MSYEEVSHTDHAIKQLQSVNQEVVAGVVAALAATAVLTIVDTNNAVDGETVTIGSKVYTFQDTLTNVANNVLIGVDDDASCANLAAAINGDAGAGTTYAAYTNPSTEVTAVAGTFIVTLTAVVKGTAGNAIVTTETMTQGSFAAGTMGSGAGNVAVTDIGLADVIESVMQIDGTSGIPTADRSGEASITGAGEILLSTTDTSADVLVVRWLSAAASLK
jgi:hypothetical protein